MTKLSLRSGLQPSIEYSAARGSIVDVFKDDGAERSEELMTVHECEFLSLVTNAQQREGSEPCCRVQNVVVSAHSCLVTRELSKERGKRLSPLLLGLLTLVAFEQREQVAKMEAETIPTPGRSRRRRPRT